MANWPFFSQAFLTNFTQKKCRDTLEDVASLAFKEFDMSVLSPESLKAMGHVCQNSFFCLAGVKRIWNDLEIFGFFLQFD